MPTEKHHKWFSPNLSLDTEMLVIGDAGVPVILFPTSKGRYFQNKDFGLVDAALPFIEAGKIKVYCVDGVDEYSFYNYGIPPSERIKNHVWYDKMIRDEVVPQAQEETGLERIIVGGCSFGGYHAANFAFRYPEIVREMISLGGAFDIRQFMHGYSDDNVYFNNPVDFMAHMEDAGLMHHFHQMGIILGTGNSDICRDDNYKMAGILHSKGIPFWLDDRPGVGHDWPWWRDMFYFYLKTIFDKEG